MKVFFDTSIWRGKSRHSTAIKSVQRLCKAKKIKMLLPYIVENEFKTQMIEAEVKEVARHNEAIENRISTAEGKILKILKAQRKATANNYNKIVESVVSIADTYLKTFNVERLGLTLEQAERAFSSYFDGDLPFSSKKCRKDIPDSFIFESLIEYSRNSPVTQMYLVVHDDGLRRALEQSEVEAFHVFKTVDQLIKHEDFQHIFANEFVHKHMKAIKRTLNSKKNKEKLAEFVEGQLYNVSFLGPFTTEVEGAENKEAIGTSISSIENDSIEFDLEDITDYGGGEVVIPFSVEAEILADYYIYKPDFWGMIDPPSYSEHNDHYVEVEDYFEVRLDGLLTLDIDAPSDSKTRFKVSMVNYDSCSIDSDVEITEL